MTPPSLARAVAFALVGCRSSTATTSGPSQTFEVVTTTVSARAVPQSIPLTGTLTAERRAELTANAAGRVTRTFVERGQRVGRGAVLVQLDVRSALANAREAGAQLVSTQTQLEAAQAECARSDGLVRSGAISQQEHDKQAATCKEKLAALEASQARAASMTLAVADGTIHAPFDGIISERFVSAGDYVQASSKVATIVVPSPLRLTLPVPERRIAEVKLGARLTFATAAMPGRQFVSEVKFLSGEIRTTTHDLVVEAVVDNDDGALLPGMFVEADLHTGERSLPVVPRGAVFASGPDPSLYVVQDGRLVLRAVMLGVALGEDVAVEEGAAVGDVVVLNPSPSMFDGATAQGGI